MKWTVLLLCCLFLLSCGTAEHETEQRETDADVQTHTELIIAADTEPASHELYGYVQDEQAPESQTPDAESLEFSMEYLMDVYALLVEHMIDLPIVGVGVSQKENKVTIDVASAEHIAPIEEFLNQEQIDAECYDICISGPIVPCDSAGEEPRL